jgi:L-ascorbate metabolism protein UlaG (beta-lactamase superfamily)
LIEPLLSDDAFLADVAAAPSRRDLLHLWWLGQSGYMVKHDRARLLIDPYLSDSLTRKYAQTEKPHVRMSRRVVDPARLGGIDIITSSHGHTDHLDAETLQAIRRNNRAILVAPRSIEALVTERWGPGDRKLVDAHESRRIENVEIIATPAAHDTLARDEKGCHLYLGYVFRLGPFTLYHSGDTVPFVDMDQHVQAAAEHPIDLAILPINGRVGNMNGTDAAGIARDLGARLVIPCHYDLFEFNTADPAGQFVPECERLKQPYRVLRLGERLTLSADNGKDGER